MPRPRAPPGVVGIHFVHSLVTSRKQHTENPSGNVGLDSGAFLLTTALFERTNQIVAFPITRAAH